MVPTLAECASSRCRASRRPTSCPTCSWSFTTTWTALILRDEKGNFVFWRSEYVRKPAKGESRAFSIQIYGLPKYASYEAYAYAS